MKRYYRDVVLMVSLISAACGSAPVQVGMNAPDPGGCYIRVYDSERFRGTSDFINGPRRHATLGSLPNRSNWNDRIRSVQVGPSATATAWRDQDFSGKSVDLGTDRAYGMLPESLVGEIESLEVRCAPQ